MFSKILRKTEKITNGSSGSIILEELSDDFKKETKLCLNELAKFTDSLTVTQALHLAIDNLTNAKSLVRKTLLRKDWINSEGALTLLEEQLEQTNLLLQNPVVANSTQATEIALKTLNYLFIAKQKVKEQFSAITKIELPEELPEIVNGNLLPEANQKLLPSPDLKIPQLIISSALLYQMHHSLFPAEKMLVGAGHRIGNDVVVDAVFEVTGEASTGHVWADNNRLSRALISMSETDSYLALWIHSHPGGGVSATYPSQTDLEQERDWLRDYSKDLVNAIMVKDKVVRFWGQALKNKQITVAIEGNGVKRVSQTEYIYQLES